MFGYFAGKGGLLAGGGLKSLITQFVGVASVTVAVIVGAMLMFGLLKAINRLRVEKIADQIGIDAYEYGVSLWPDVLPMPSISYVKDDGSRAAAD